MHLVLFEVWLKLCSENITDLCHLSLNLLSMFKNIILTLLKNVYNLLFLVYIVNKVYIIDVVLLKSFQEVFPL